MAIESKFETSGTLEKPGPIGRFVRLALGIACLHFVWVLLTGGSWLANNVTSNPMFWLLLAFGIHVFPYVVNIGFTKSWGRGPQFGILILMVAAGGWSLIQDGLVWGAPLGWLVVVWLFYVYSHLGISMLIASIIGTPGCEMRAIPHLRTLLTGRETKEHYCPGFLNGLDAWERKAKMKYRAVK